MSKFDPSLDYDYEDTQRFMAENEIENNKRMEEIENAQRNRE